MILGGFQKFSLIDYPEKVSCIVFVKGCNFTCPYCHNPDLVTGTCKAPLYLNEQYIHDFLKHRKGLIDGVVISGGEPTLQKNLLLFCEQLKKCDIAIKLDTNGSNPEVLHTLLQEGLVDYIAMDVKTNPAEYSPLLIPAFDYGTIITSIGLVMSSRIDYEFRTTCIKPLITFENITKITEMIAGARRYILQQFRNTTVLQPNFFTDTSLLYTSDELRQLKRIAEKKVCTCSIR